MPHAGYANSITNDGHGSHSDISDKELLKPITRVIKVTLPTVLLYFLMYDHSFILSHTCIHTFIHTIIHSSHTFKASHMQLMHHNAPCYVMKR